tara:strand:+ start:1186 stop:1539 length:354 start_codon:yes stop_codon:yes gene_type:complete
MELKCQDFHFKNSSIYGTIQKIDSYTNTYYTDLKQQELSIRVFGTEKEIDNAVDEYLDGTSLFLDECYNFKIEKRGTYWGDFYGNELEEHNKKVSEKLEGYNKIYKKENKPLIIKLI